MERDEECRRVMDSGHAGGAARELHRDDLQADGDGHVECGGLCGQLPAAGGAGGAVEHGGVGQDGALPLHGPAGDGAGEDGRERAHPGAVRLPAVRASGAGARGAADGAGGTRGT